MTIPPDESSKFAAAGVIQKLTFTAAKSAWIVESEGKTQVFLKPQSCRRGWREPISSENASRISSAICKRSGQLNPEKKNAPSRPSA